MKWPEPGYINSERSEKGITLRAATSKQRFTPMRDTHESGGFGVCCGFGDAREEPSRRRRYAVARFDAAN
jgi:hypothetical protein